MNWIIYWWRRLRGRCVVCNNIKYDKPGDPYFVGHGICRTCVKRSVHMANYGGRV